MIKNYLLFILLALLWSFSFLGIKISVENMPPIFSAAMRVMVAFLTLSIVFTFKNHSQNKQQIFVIPISNAWRLWITGLFTQALPFAFLFYGEKFIAPALASIINSTVSIWALLLGTLLFRDWSQWTPAKIIGLLLGLTGICFIFLPFLQTHHDGNLRGVLSVMIMAICYAIGGLLTQHVVFAKMKTSFESNLWHQHGASLIFLIICSFLFEPLPSAAAILHPKIIIAILYLGIFGTAMAWMIYFYLIKHWGTVRAASAMYIVPILAICWDYLFLHLIPTWNEWAGIAAILSGVTLIQYQRKRGC